MHHDLVQRLHVPEPPRLQQTRISFLLAIPASLALFFYVLLFPAISRGLFGREYVVLAWDLLFGLFWWVSDVWTGRIDGAVAGLAFFAWPALVAFVSIVGASLAYRCTGKTIRIGVVALVVFSLTLVAPIDYSEGAAYQMLPFWHRYQFLVF